MATSLELAAVVAKALGLPQATVVQHLRNLQKRRDIAFKGYGRGAARMGPADAARLLIAAVGSDQVKDSAGDAGFLRVASAGVDRGKGTSAAVDVPRPRDRAARRNRGRHRGRRPSAAGAHQHRIQGDVGGRCRAEPASAIRDIEDEPRDERGDHVRSRGLAQTRGRGIGFRHAAPRLRLGSDPDQDRHNRRHACHRRRAVAGLARCPPIVGIAARTSAKRPAEVSALECAATRVARRVAKSPHLWPIVRTTARFRLEAGGGIRQRGRPERHRPPAPAARAERRRDQKRRACA